MGGTQARLGLGVSVKASERVSVYASAGYGFNLGGERRETVQGNLGCGSTGERRAGDGFSGHENTPRRAHCALPPEGALFILGRPGNEKARQWRSSSSTQDSGYERERRAGQYGRRGGVGFAMAPDRGRRGRAGPGSGPGRVRRRGAARRYARHRPATARVPGGRGTAVQAGNLAWPRQPARRAGPSLVRPAARRVRPGRLALAGLLDERGRGLARTRQLERAQGSAEPLYAWASAGKQAIAAVVLQLADEGRLSLSDTLARRLPDAAKLPNAERITIAQLLAHTSGLYSANEVRAAQGMRGPYAARGAGYPGAPRRAVPGACWRYSNSGYRLLGAIIARVTGRPGRTKSRRA